MPVLQIDSLKSKEIIPGFLARMSAMDQMLFSHWTIEKDAVLPFHHHEQEQISILIKGRFEFILENEKFDITPGMVVMIPSNAEHGN